MHTTVIVYRLSVCFSLYLTVSSLYLPHMKPQQSRRSRHQPMSLSMDSHVPRTSHGQVSHTWSKRHSPISRFTSTMKSHARKHKNDQAFVDVLFGVFDINRNKMIDRREFKLVLQIMGIVSHF